ncbi:hypothetical protein HDU92_003787 [Lobulomyces angularis]|nr:hypothetical protein HDU92_003787 [Lobulomyces angularis]
MFVFSEKFLNLKQILTEFVELECIPAEKTFFLQMGKVGTPERWRVSLMIIPEVLEELKAKAKTLGLWNLFLAKEYGQYGAGLTNLEYAVLCETLGKSFIAPEACNCSAPDTGNMEVLAKYGNEAQKEKWLKPLLDGKIRSAFAMTEPRVASSDATNIETYITKDPKNPDYYLINGRKWWISGAGDPRCKIYLLMGKNDANNKDKHRQQSVIIIPADTPGITVLRPLTVFGYDDAPHGHCEILFENVRVHKENMILGEGRGFEIVQGRLGPGRIHHCMRQIGFAERALEYHILRVTDSSRKTFGKFLFQHGDVATTIAQSRMEIEGARMLVLAAASQIDKGGAKSAMKQIAMAKVICPNMTLRVIDRSIQAHGGAGVSQDFPLAYMYAGSRTLRIADGPDEVHMMQIARSELKKAKDLSSHYEKQQKIAADFKVKHKL